jgi:hypothetical protein
MDRRLDALLRDAARSYHLPPVTPGEQMWTRIEVQRGRLTMRRTAGQWSTGTSRRLWWLLAAAAALVVGIAIGRYTAGPAGPPRASEVAAVFRAEDSPAPAPLGGTQRTPGETGSMPSTSTDPMSRQGGEEVALFRSAADPVLSRADLLLTQLTTSGPATISGPGFLARAANLLAETRLLLGSPAAEDTELQRLLSDLELALAQVLRTPTAPTGVGESWIDRSLTSHSLLTRLRSRIARDQAKVSL